MPGAVYYSTIWGCTNWSISH